MQTSTWPAAHSCPWYMCGDLQGSVEVSVPLNGHTTGVSGLCVRARARLWGAIFSSPQEEVKSVSTTIPCFDGRSVTPCVLTEGPCRGTDFGGCLATRQTELWLTWVCIPAYLCRADSNKTTLIATPGHHHNMKISSQKTVMEFSSISRLQHVLKAAPLRGPTTPPAHRRGPTRSWLSTIGPTTPP